MAFRRKQQPAGTVHVTLRGPLPELPTEGAVRIPVERQPDGSVTFETEIPGVDGLTDEQVLETPGPGTELVLGADGVWRIAESG